MQFPMYAAVTAAALLMLQQLLMLTVGGYRAKVETYVGTGNDPNMERLARRHGNLAENAAIFVATLALTELLVGSTTILFWFAAIFVFGRICHAIAFSSLVGSHGQEGNKIFIGLRIIGAFSTALLGIALGAYLIYSLMAI